MKVNNDEPNKIELATLAAGCFWCYKGIFNPKVKKFKEKLKSN